MEFKNKDILDVYEYLGLEKVGTDGSHVHYVHPRTNTKATFLKHGNNTIKEGTGKSMLDFAIWIAFLEGDEILAKGTNDFSKDVKDYFSKRYAEISQKPIMVIPQEVRKQFNINPLASDPENVARDLKERILKNRQLAIERADKGKGKNNGRNL